MRIVLAGASGFIGKRLIQRLLEENHTLYLLTRDPEKTSASFDINVICVKWDARSVGPWSDYIGEADAVINLAGESLAAKRWNDVQKERLWSSRIESTRAIVDAMKVNSKKPKVLINASAVGYYGNVPDGDVEETHDSADDFLGKLCLAWEEEALKAEQLGVRVVLPRIGIVLGDGGGALDKMTTPFKWFVGGPLGTGRQFMPWIHMEDLVRILQFLLNSNLSGPFNATAPNPVTMKAFSEALAEILNRPSWAPVPGFLLYVVVGEFARTLLGGQQAVPARLLKNGFEFRYPDLQPALKDLLGPKDNKKSRT